MIEQHALKFKLLAKTILVTTKKDLKFKDKTGQDICTIPKGTKLNLYQSENLPEYFFFEFESHVLKTNRKSAMEKFAI